MLFSVMAFLPVTLSSRLRALSSDCFFSHITEIMRSLACLASMLVSVWIFMVKDRFADFMAL